MTTKIDMNLYSRKIDELNCIKSTPFKIPQNTAICLKHLARAGKMFSAALEIKMAYAVDASDNFEVDIDLETFALTGVAFEIGELGDEIKKYAYHKKYSREKILSELGDIYFYAKYLRDSGQHYKDYLDYLLNNVLFFVRSMLDISNDEIFKFNLEKLSQRYAHGYVDGGGKR